MDKALIVDARGQPMRRADARPDSIHRGASWNSQELAQWFTGLRSADASYLGERDSLVARVRDLARNNGWAAGAVQRSVDAVIGGGLNLIAQPNHTALGIAPDAAFEWARQVEAKFQAWANDPRCFVDATRQTNFAGILALAFRHRILDGEALLVGHWLPRRRGAYATAVEVIDPDRLSTPDGREDDERLRGGVELDAHGAALAYHIRRGHQNDVGGLRGAMNSFTWVRVLRETGWGRPRTIHFFERDQAGQHRGKGLLTPVIEKLRMLDRYDRVEMQAALLNAILAAFIESPMDNDSSEAIFGSHAASISPYQEARGEFYKDNEVRLDGVLIPKLFPQDKLRFETAQRPHDGYEPFVQAGLRNLAAATGLSYEQISHDWSKTNYSSARAALIEVWRFLTARRLYFAQGVATPIYAMWLEEAIDKGTVTLPAGAPDFHEAYPEYVACRWIGPGRGWVDPTKEAQAAQMRLDANLSTLRAEAAEQGLDYYELLEQQAREKREMEALDLSTPASASPEALGVPVEHASDQEGQKS